MGDGVRSEVSGGGVCVALDVAVIVAVQVAGSGIPVPASDSAGSGAARPRNIVTPTAPINPSAQQAIIIRTAYCMDGLVFFCGMF